MRSTTNAAKATNPPTTAYVCRYKACRKMTKLPQNSNLVKCENAACDCSVHVACLAGLRIEFGASISTAFCSKRCYNAIKKQVTAPPPAPKKRVPWDSDGPTPDVNSMSLLMDWLTTEGNYNRYRGGDPKNGSTKSTLAGEISRQITDAGISTPRPASVVMWKITDIEASYKQATDWLAQTGQGVTVESDIRNAVEMRCPMFYRLESIMGSRPSFEPLALNSRVGDENTVARENSTGARSKTSSKPNTVANKRKGAPTPDPYNSSLIELRETQIKNEHLYQKETLLFKTRKMDIEEKKIELFADRAKSELNESRARAKEARAKTAKLEQEAAMAELQRKIALLRERQKLALEGVPQEDIDRLLPLQAMVN